MIEQLLKNPISIPILQLLAKEPSNIPQIAAELQIELLPCIAVVSELFHFGLVLPAQKSSNEQIHPSKYLNDLTNTSLGLPMQEYLALWEGLQQNEDQVDQERLKRQVFTVPPDLVPTLKQHEPEEIRALLLGKL
ncbi:MAG: hypothetical protein ACFFE8_08010 [Candidatus Heimdallarchaeota archaeon]